MTRVGFKPTISAGERPKSYALDRAATGTGEGDITNLYNPASLIRTAFQVLVIRWGMLQGTILKRTNATMSSCYQ